MVDAIAGIVRSVTPFEVCPMPVNGKEFVSRAILWWNRFQQAAIDLLQLCQIHKRLVEIDSFSMVWLGFVLVEGSPFSTFRLVGTLVAFSRLHQTVFVSNDGRLANLQGLLDVSFRLFNLCQCQPPLRVSPIICLDRLVQPSASLVDIAQLVGHAGQCRKRKAVADAGAFFQSTFVRALRVLQKLRTPIQIAESVMQSMVGGTVFDSLFENFHRLGNLSIVEFVNPPGVVRVGKGGVLLNGPLVAPNPKVRASLVHL
mmetsp:Transcript_18596/g.46135  ORF Transcript_18596/g.46135 Transcript_18596/m.46135 type:complete len:257 (-) Transcript_18596:1376-2146(-)